MPVLMISTNVTAGNSAVVLHRLSREVAEMLGKPESYVMVSINGNADLIFAATDEPCAYLGLKSLGLPESETKTFSTPFDLAIWKTLIPIGPKPIIPIVSLPCNTACFTAYNPIANGSEVAPSSMD